MGKIIIRRSSQYRNRMRDYGVYIDGNKVDTISNGGVKELSLNTGNHRLYFKVDWCSSPIISFDLADDETKVYQVGGFKLGNWITPFMFAVLVLGFTFKKAVTPYFYGLIIPPFLILLYYLTIGRRNYLTVKEV